MPVFFDVDDTLVDHRGAADRGVLALHQRFAGRLGVSAEQFAARWHEAAERHFAEYAAGQCSYQEQRRRRVRDFFGAGINDGEADALFAVYLAAYESAWALFPDALPCLDALRGTALGVISNNATEPTLAKLRATGIAERFAVVITPDVAGAGKPDPAIFLAACARLEAPPQSCLYVGDKRDLDADAARRAGMIGVWLNRRGEEAGSGDGVAHIRSLAELPLLLQENGE